MLADVRRVAVTLLAIVGAAVGAIALAHCASSSGSPSDSTHDAGADGTAFDAPADVPLDVDPALRAAAQAACASESEAYCARALACVPTFLAEAFGTMATCVARYSLACTPTILAVGSQTTAADVQACATALATADCGALFVDDSPPVACQTIAGALPSHAKCAFSAQCVGGLCLPGPSGCGSCVSQNEAGADCTDTDECGYGTICVSGACVAPAGGAGATCTTTQPCDAPFICESGTLTCVAPLEAGAECDPLGANPCDGTQGVVCVPAPDPPLGGLCTQPMLVATGPCGAVATGFAVCSAGGLCANVDSNGEGSCVPAAADGMPCDGTNGPLCLPPAICVSGTCVVDDENSCR